MKAHFYLRRNMLLVMLALVMGVSSAWAVSEDFESVTIQKDGVDISSWQWGNGLSNGWFVIGGGGIYTNDDYASGYYALVSGGNPGKCLGYNYGTSNPADMVIGMVGGKLKFDAKKGSRKTNKVSVYAVEGTEGNYTRGALIGSVTPTSTWTEYEIDCGNTPQMVAINLISAYIDNVEYESAAVTGPVLAVTREGGALNSGAVIDLGAENDPGTQLTLTLANTGEATLNITSMAWNSDKFAVSNETATIAVGESMDLTLTMPVEAGTYSGTLTIKGDDIDDFSLTVNVGIVALLPVMDVTTTGSLNFGFATAATDREVTITNTGRADLTGLSATIAANSDEGFTALLNATTVAPGESATLTLSMAADIKGYRQGQVNVSAEGQETVEITLEGWVADETKILVSFDDGLPERWENNGWTISGGVAKGVYVAANASRNSEMTTPKLKVESGEVMAIEAKGTGSYPELKVYTSTDGTQWTCVANLDEAMDANRADYTVLLVKDIPAGSYLFKFEGYNVEVNNINGFIYDDNAPVMTVTDAEGNKLSGTVTLALGKVREAVATTYNVTNTGTGELFMMLSSTTADFTVDKEEITLAAGESDTFTVTVEPLPYGAKSAIITIITDDDEFNIEASAISIDPNTWEEDFEEGVVPEGWTANGWTVSQPSAFLGGNGTYMFGAGSSTNTAYTPRLYGEEGQTLTFDLYAETSYPLTVKWAATRDAEEWTEIGTYTEAETVTFTAPATGYYFLSFSGRYTYVDNFSGLKYAPLDHDAQITALNIPAMGQELVEYIATVSVTEAAGKEETLTATFFIGETQYGEAVTKTVAVNGSETFEVTFTPDGAISGDAYFVITNEDISLTTDRVAVTISAAPVLDESSMTVDGDTQMLSDFDNWGSYPVLKLRYSLVEGYNTIVLPFAVSDLSVFGETVTAYEFDDYVDGLVMMRSVSSLNAQQPYILHSEEARDEFLFTDVTNFRASAAPENINTTKQGIVLQGTYTPVSAPDMDGLYLVAADGSLQRGADDDAITGFHAYFDFSVSPAQEYMLSFDGVVTGISEATVFDDVKGDIFDLQGRKVTAPQRGIYIVSGKKVVVK